MTDRPEPPFAEQQREMPGTTAQMNAGPDHGEGS